MPDETDVKSNIVQLVQRKTPKQIALAFYNGSLTAEDRMTLGAGMRNLIALAETDNERATTAKRAALKDLAELADLARDQSGAEVTHTVEIVKIRSIDNKVAIMEEEA